MYKYLIYILVICDILFHTANAQEKKGIDLLQKFSTDCYKQELLAKEKLQTISKEKGWDFLLKNEYGNVIGYLTGIDIHGLPIYTIIDNNTTSASTTNTQYLWNTPYNLNGSSSNLANKMAIWDEGSVLSNHIEINNRILIKDFSGSASHSTHVGGTLIASGLNINAKGIAWGCKQLLSYDFQNHLSEMASQAASLLVSNHSYGVACGWSKNIGGDWTYYGLTTDTADYKFGIYDSETRVFDSLSFLAPYYLIIKSAGNNRDKNGPALGQPYKAYDANGVLVNMGARPIGLSSNDGFDNIPTYGVAKNILTIGAIEGTDKNTDIPSNIKMTSFSNWGPTDDGRIKPDLVAAGLQVLSCTNDSITAYGYNSGTSMATPNVTGSLFLLQELHSKIYNGNFLKAAALKALAIHTANEAGDFEGPDYKFGWGLLNAKKAAETILNSKNNVSKIIDTSITNNSDVKIKCIASGREKLKATIVWTDVAGNATTTNLLNNPTLKLVNDLDARMSYKSKTYLPWCLNPASPASSAFKGDNFRDNVEQIEIDSVIAGEEYELTIIHKNLLRNDYQNFSIIITGIDTTSYCTPYTVNNSNIKIDSFQFANFKSNQAVCSAYDNYKSEVAFIKSLKKYPLQINISSCNSTATNKVAKLYIDFDGNKKFNDQNELVYSSTIINGDGIIKDSVLIPNDIKNGIITIARLVVVETSSNNSFNACSNSNMVGSIQDFSVKIFETTNDIELAYISNPSQNSCAYNKQFITVNIQNNGIDSIVNIPLHITISKSNAIISTFSDTCKTTIHAKENFNYTIQAPISFLADSTYSINITSNVVNDEVASNNTIKHVVKFSAPSNQVLASATVCNNLALLTKFNPQPLENYLWYTTNDSSKAITSGSNTSTNFIANKYLLTNGGWTSLGELDKSISTSGTYHQKGGNYFYYSANYPLILNSAKLYTAHVGKVTIIAADTIQTFPDGSYNYKTLSSTTIDVSASKPNPQSGDVNMYDVDDKGLYYNINLLLPHGNHILIVKTDSVANIFRNNKISVKKYPYNASNLIMFSGNNATNQDSFYYYLYDMQLSTLQCRSEFTSVIPIAASIPSITKIADTLLCSSALQYQWFYNNNKINGATSQYYKTNIAGSYTVEATDNKGCTTTSNAFIVGNTKTIYLYPNPAYNLLNISFGEDLSNNTEIAIFDILGFKRFSKYYATVSNGYTEKINTLPLQNGTYFIKLINDNKTVVEKFIIAR